MSEDTDVQARLTALEMRLNSAEAALALVVGVFKTHKIRMPAALLGWYSHQTPPEGMPLP